MQNFHQLGSWLLGRIHDYPGDLNALGITPEYAERRLRDCCCVMHYRRTYDELEAEGDKGLLKIARLFPDCLQNNRIRDRYWRAQHERDTPFLERFTAAQRNGLISTPE
jgi:hypothetical protein